MSRKFGVKEVVGIALSVVLGLVLFAAGAFWLKDKLEDKIDSLLPDFGSELPDDSSEVEDPSGSESENPGDSSEAEHTAHDWVELRYQAETCDSQGTMFYECACGALMAKTVPVAEHVEVVLEYTAATCEAEGSKTYKCANCDLSVTETIPALGHAYEYGVCKNVDCYTPDAEWLDDSENYYLETPVEGELMHGNWYRVYNNNELIFVSNSVRFKLKFDF